MRCRVALAVAVGLFLGLVAVVGAQGPASACRPGNRAAAHACSHLVVHAHNPDGLLWVPWHPERWRDRGPR